MKIEKEVPAATPDLVASVNGSYTDAAMVSTTLINAGFNPGTPIQQIPRWTSSGALSYRHRLTDQLAWSARADYTYTGSRTDVTYATNTLPSYTLANVRGGVEGARWSTTLFINNVADKRAQLSNIVQTAINLPTFNRVAVSQPRTIGIDVSYRFGH